MFIGVRGHRSSPLTKSLGTDVGSFLRISLSSHMDTYTHHCALRRVQGRPLTCSPLVPIVRRSFTGRSPVYPARRVLAIVFPESLVPALFLPGGAFLDSFYLLGTCFLVHTRPRLSPRFPPFFVSRAFCRHLHLVSLVCPPSLFCRCVYRGSEAAHVPPTPVLTFFPAASLFAPGAT